MTDLIALDLITGCMAALTAFLVGMGFVRLAILDRGPMGHFAAGLLLVHLAVLLRTLYRDIGPRIVEDDVWSRLFDPAGHLAVTVTINLLVIYSGYHSLKALLLVIPADRRGDYSLVTAALYPPWGIAAAPRALIRRLRNRR
jgi:hypothetical protein